MQRIKNILAKFNWKTVVITIVILSFLALFSSASIIILTNGFPDTNASEESDVVCNVAVIKIQGELVSYKYGGDDEWTDETVLDDIYYPIGDAEDDPNIKAVILEINSGGGSPFVGQEIANAMKRLKKPSIALIGEAATSAAYWAATGANKIFASNQSTIGSIGLTMSYLDNVEKNKKEGLNYNELVSAKYKGIGNPDQLLTWDEKQMITEELNFSHNIFVSDVARNRGLKIEDVAKLANGARILPDKALDSGLIDKIGGMYEAIQSLAETIGMDEKDISSCNYGY